MACHFVRWNSTPDALDTSRLSAALIADADAYAEKRRQRFLQGRVLLAETLHHLYGLSTLPPIATTPTGRPCFCDPHLPDFSLAYAGNTVGVLLSNEGKVGLDIEMLRARSASQRQLQRQFRNVPESAWIDAQDDLLEAETQLWSIRQSVLKISGLGNSGHGTLTLHPFSGQLRSSITPQVQVMSDSDDYQSWSCAREPALERLQCWQFDPQYGLEKCEEISAQSPANSLRFIKLTSLSNYHKNSRLKEKTG